MAGTLGETPDAKKGKGKDFFLKMFYILSTALRAKGIRNASCVYNVINISEV